MKMLRAAANYFASVPAVFTDGLLYVLIAVLAFAQTAMASDDAAKYIPAEMLFWTKMTLGIANAAVVAIKMYRSTQFAEHQAEKKKNGHTQFLNRTDTGPQPNKPP